MVAKILEDIIGYGCLSLLAFGVIVAWIVALYMVAKMVSIALGDTFESAVEKVKKIIRN